MGSWMVQGGEGGSGAGQAVGVGVPSSIEDSGIGLSKFELANNLVTSSRILVLVLRRMSS